MHRFLFLCFFVVATADVIYDGPCPDVKPQDNFDFYSYQGTWYETARYPNAAEGGAKGKCTTIEYLRDGNRNTVQYSQVIDNVRSYMAGDLAFYPPAKLMMTFTFRAHHIASVSSLPSFTEGLVSTNIVHGSFSASAAVTATGKENSKTSGHKDLLPKALLDFALDIKGNNKLQNLVIKVPYVVEFGVTKNNFYSILDTDYQSYAIGYSCTYFPKTNTHQVYSWIMSRTPTMNAYTSAAVNNYLSQSKVLDVTKFITNDYSPEACYAPIITPITNFL